MSMMSDGHGGYLLHGLDQIWMIYWVGCWTDETGLDMSYLFFGDWTMNEYDNFENYIPFESTDMFSPVFCD